MTYKSLLTVLTDTRFADAALRQITALAQAQDAHAEALCLGVDRTHAGFYYASANAMILQESIERARAESEDILAHAETQLKQAGIRWSSEAGVAQLADLGRYVGHHARFADLVIAPRPYGENRGVEAEALVEAALFDGRAPVLVVPDDAQPLVNPSSVVIAWNESVEALAAIRKSLPFLKMAKNARITVIDPPQHGPERSDPGGMLSQMLSRHGVKCEIDVLSKTVPRISDVLIRHATDTGSDLIVMGAYGHSRLREAILGGATRNMLDNASIPVLMAH